MAEISRGSVFGPSDTLVDGDVRFPLDAFPNIYVNSTTGDDGNDGSAAAPLKTLDHAIGYASSLHWRDFSGFPTIILASGSYTTTTTDYANGMPAVIGGQGLVIKSATGNPADVTIAVTGLVYLLSSNLVRWQNVTFTGLLATLAENGGFLEFHGCVLNLVGGVDRCTMVNYASYILYKNCTFNITGSYGTFAQVNGEGSAIEFAGTLTFTGSPAFSLAFANVTGGALLNAAGTGPSATYPPTAVTFTGTVTGKRYQATGFGKIFTNNGGANYLPGNSAGSVDGSSTYW